jgi:hypothetical protein
LRFRLALGGRTLVLLSVYLIIATLHRLVRVDRSLLLAGVIGRCRVGRIPRPLDTGGPDIFLALRGLLGMYGSSLLARVYLLLRGGRLELGRPTRDRYPYETRG